MNITLLINYDLAATLALNYLLPELSEHKLSLFFTRKSRVTNRPNALEKLAEFETFSLSLLNSQASTSSLKSIEQFEAPTIQTIECLNDVNGRDFSTLQTTQPDLILSIRHMTILKQAVIDLPKYGVINLHSGFLPNYQGVMASFWAMLNGENSLASTLHFIDDAQIDTGAIIETSVLRCQTDKSYLWNVLNLYHSGCQTMLRTIDRICAGRSVGSVQQSATARYFTYPQQIDLDQFTARGLRLFDLTDAEAFGLT